MELKAMVECYEAMVTMFIPQVDMTLELEAGLVLLKMRERISF